MMSSFYRSATALNVWLTLAARTSLNVATTQKTNRNNRFFSTVTNFQASNRLAEVDKIKDLSSLIEVTKRLYDGKLFDGNNASEYKIGMPPIPKNMMYWFRGDGVCNRDLIPTVYRGGQQTEKEGYFESALVNGFMLNHPEYNLKDQDILKILSTMQHYSYPTRLLDWNTNMMYAAYFACKKPKYDNKEDSIIWILDPFRLNLHSSLSEKVIGIAMGSYFDAKVRSIQSIVDTYEELAEYSEHFAKSIIRPEGMFNIEDVIKFIRKCAMEKNQSLWEYSVAVDPGNLNDRLSAQKGKFTISGGKFYYDKEKIKGTTFSQPISIIDQAKKIREDHNIDCLKCIIIDKDYRKNIREDLQNILGIDDSTLMLDLDFHGAVSENLFKFTRKK
jgi:hypothetical protein